MGRKRRLAIRYQIASHKMVQSGAGILGLVLVLALCGCVAQPERTDPMLPFQMLDADGGGEVSRREWKRSVDVATSRLPPGTSAEEYRCRNMKLFENLDTNQDDQLSPAEWKYGKFNVGADVCPSQLNQ